MEDLVKMLCVLLIIFFYFFSLQTFRNPMRKKSKFFLNNLFTVINVELDFVDLIGNQIIRSLYGIN